MTDSLYVVKVAVITVMRFLIQSKSAVYTRRFHKVCIKILPTPIQLMKSDIQTLNHLIRIVWEAALPPSVCAVVVLITYFVLSPFSLWSIGFIQILGQLYVISLFVTL